MAQPDARIRQIKIKTGVVKRSTKEMAMYEKEANDLEAKVNKMKDEKADDADIRKQTEVLQESRMMIPDTKKRLRTACDDLDQMLQKESDLSEKEEFAQAKEVLEAGRTALSS